MSAIFIGKCEQALSRDCSTGIDYGCCALYCKSVGRSICCDRREIDTSVTASNSRRRFYNSNAPRQTNLLDFAIGETYSRTKTSSAVVRLPIGNEGIKIKLEKNVDLVFFSGRFFHAVTL